MKGCMKAIQEAIEKAANGYIVTFGMCTKPERDMDTLSAKAMM
jgi:hypothetical protein